MAPHMSIVWLGDDLNDVDEVLKAGYGADHLLVLDAGANISRLLDVSDECLIERLRDFAGSNIVLARSFQDGMLVSGPHNICELHRLDDQALILLLRRQLGPKSFANATEAQLISAIRSMACSPRAIIRIASFLNNSGMQVSQLLKLYQKSEKISLRLFSRQEPRLKYSEDTSIIFRGVFDIEIFRETHPQPSRILFQLYFLGGTSVPLSIFDSVDNLDLILIMALLKGHFLLAQTDDQTFTIRPLVYLAIKNTLEMGNRKLDDPDVQDEKKWQEQALVEFAKQYPAAENKIRK